MGNIVIDKKKEKVGKRNIKEMCGYYLMNITYESW